MQGGKGKRRCAGESTGTLSCTGVEGAVSAGVLSEFCSPSSRAAVPKYALQPNKDLRIPLACVSTLARSWSVLSSRSCEWWWLGYIRGSGATPLLATWQCRLPTDTK